MLTQIISIASAQAEAIARLAGTPRAVADHMRAFANGVVPTVSAAQGKAAAFASAGQRTVERLLQSLPAPGAALSNSARVALHQDLQPLVDSARQAGEAVSGAKGRVDTAREQFSTDAGNLKGAQAEAHASFEESKRRSCRA